MTDEMHEREEYPPHIAALLEDARPLDAPPASVKAAVRERVQATVSAPVPPSTTSAALPKLAMTLIGAGAIAAALWFARAPRTDAPHRAAAPIEAPAAEPDVVAAVVAAREQPASPSAAVDSGATAVVVSEIADGSTVTANVTPVATPASSPADTLADEQRLLDRARDRLASSDADGALSALSQHARRYPRGVLTMEREALRVRALLAGEQREEARATAARFVARWPTSALRSAVEAMVR
jgi:hypothetical protein